jgi:hypothetical protein
MWYYLRYKSACLVTERGCFSAREAFFLNLCGVIGDIEDGIASGTFFVFAHHQFWASACVSAPTGQGGGLTLNRL